MQFTLRDAHLIDATKDIARGAIIVEGTHIKAVEYPEYSSDEPDSIIDVTDMIVMPGFIDVHTHGGGGYNLHTTDADEIRGYARWVPETGVTSFLIAIVGAGLLLINFGIDEIADPRLQHERSVKAGKSKKAVT